MAAEKIGVARCPVCKSGGASVSLSKKGLVCMTCNACNLQIFARSGRSDELLRACITPASAPTAAPVPPPPSVPAAAPVQASEAARAAGAARRKEDLENALGIEPKRKPFGMFSWP